MTICPKNANFSHYINHTNFTFLLIAEFNPVMALKNRTKYDGFFFRLAYIYHWNLGPVQQLYYALREEPTVVSFWPGLGLPRPKAIVVIPQNQPLPKHLRKKTSKSAKHACHYATKERPVKITMYLGLAIIIKIKFTTIFDRCAILNVLNYLTKNFES